MFLNFKIIESIKFDLLTTLRFLIEKVMPRCAPVRKIIHKKEALKLMNFK